MRLVPNRDIRARWSAPALAAGSRSIISEPAALRERFGTPWSSSFDIDIPAATQGFHDLTLHVFVACSEVWFLSAEREFRKLQGRISTLRPLGKFFVARSKTELFRIEVPQACGLDLIMRDSGVEIVAPLFSRRLCGLTLWGKGKLAAPPSLSTVELVVNRLEDIFQCIWLEPYPDGVRSVLCLTDHADFDTVEKVRLLADVFERYQFRVTKSVFPGPKVTTSQYGPGLEDEAYRAQIRRLFEQGSEVCFHGFTSDRDAPPIDECHRRIEAMMEFSPRTWIDHGTGSYLLSRTGRLAEGALLVELLSRYGIINYWSYTDIWNNPFAHLTSWGKQARNIPGEFFTGLKAMKHKTIEQLAYLGMHCLKNAMGDHGVATLRSRVTSASQWSEAYRLSIRLREVRSDPLLLYGFDGGSYAANLARPWVFDTTLLNHLSAQLAPKVIDELIQQSGTLIGHCYFAEQHPYGFTNCFQNISGKPHLLAEFEQDLAHIKRRSLQHELIALPLAGLRASLTSFASSRLERVEQGWLVQVADGAAPITVAFSSAAARRVRYASELCHIRGNTLYCSVSRAGTTTVNLSASEAS